MFLGNLGTTNWDIVPITSKLVALVFALKIGNITCMVETVRYLQIIIVKIPGYSEKVKYETNEMVGLDKGLGLYD